MSALQKIDLGTAPEGKNGDTVRTGFTKLNANADTLSAQVALTSAPLITVSQTLTADHIGKRVCVSFAAADGIIKMSRAASCAPDSLVWVVNAGAKAFQLGVDDNSGDSIALGALNPGEAAVLDTDGVHTWRVLLRGRTWAVDESVSGKLTVASDLNVGGGASVSGKLAVASDLSVGGGASFGVRPTFSGKTPWDAGNFNPANYVTANTFQILTARKRINASQATGEWGDQTFVVESDLSQTGIGFRSSTGALVFRYNNSNSSFECVNWNSSAYAPIGASGFTVSSDYRLKSIIGEINDPIARVRNFRPIMAEYRSSPGKAYPMFIAHVLQDAAPHAVFGEKDAVDADGLPIYQSVDYSKITPDLAAAIIALADENVALRVRVSKLEATACK
ncbi:hypothetical protein [Burkholderia diffusa]|uniref:hypothetical protein n=1 Tax=Burkholderia diffusa TaxID=488732 RepID=UPI00157B3512|nr:hypothetical protein [Burkholderia diffusa]NTY35811.1 hypothetical protein [Burkholderia diffusa]